MLTWPLIATVASAGVLGGVHCAGMCGGVATMLGGQASSGRVIPIKQADSAVGWRRQVLLHGGRLSAYALMGAVVGAIGAAGLLFRPIVPVHTILFIVGNLALIWLGLRLAGYAPRFGSIGGGIVRHVRWPARLSLAAQAQRHPFVAGMAWACLPCGILYGILPFALLSGDPFSGAALMLIFGLTALPHLLLAQGAAGWLRQRRMPMVWKRTGAIALVSFGLFGLWHFNTIQAASVFCLSPVH